MRAVVVLLLAVAVSAQIDSLFDNLIDDSEDFYDLARYDYDRGTTNGSCTKCGQPDPVSSAYWCSKFTGWSQDCCNCIVKAESNSDAHFCSGTSDGNEEVGLFAINQEMWQTCSGGKPPCDPATNLACAEAMYKANNSFAGWASCNKCNCCTNKVGTCKPFADQQWNCATPSCSSKVNAGSPQPQYECAEFAARTIASANLLPLDPQAPQDQYGHWSYNGKSYDLLWTSSKSGGRLGLEDAVAALGWTSAGSDASAITDCSVILVDGSEGAYSHVVVGIGSNLVDAHNMARYHEQGRYYTINAVWNPPSQN
jgi:hypothetical protein